MAQEDLLEEKEKTSHVHFKIAKLKNNQLTMSCLSFSIALIIAKK